MDNMSPQQQQPQDALSRGGGGGGAGQPEYKRRMRSQSYRRQSAPSLVLTKALTRSKTLSRESFMVPLCPETCPLVQSFLAASDRSFLLHGHAQLKTGMQTQDRHLFLFNDIIVIAKAKSANHFKQKAQVRVCEMWTASCMDEVCEGSTNPERSFVIGWPTCNCVATFSSTEQKERWLSLLKSRIKDEKEKEEPKTIPMRVYGKGINSFAVTKTLPVSNSDSSNEVIRLALQQFGIIVSFESRVLVPLTLSSAQGNVKDYQLWVLSKRDNSPYPLIGHEFPFSIQMSHVRPAVSQGGRDAAAISDDRQRALQPEQLYVNKQCQFILRPRPAETSQQQQQHIPADFYQKTFKRRRSLITWAFWRGSSPQLNELSPAGAPRGCLFRQPLSSICMEDTLPKPVTDMLTFLYHEGSWTRGIFRRPAGARAVRELRDSLDAGEFQLPLTRDHVFIIAGVFKDFLRNIPGSLLCSELYEEWMDVLEEEEEEEERVQDIQRTIARLPKGNTLLLRHLLAMLHGIQGNAQENQMTSFNLSVCIAPSMLWPPGAPCSPEIEGDGAKKVCELVKFMIEHCLQILGEEPSSVFGGPPQRLNADEMGSESWNYPLTDSSYDSLENELDNSSSGSPGLCSRRKLRPKPLRGSLDSILTFSDFDQDTEQDHVQRDALLGRGDPDFSSPSQESPPLDASRALDSLSLDGRHKHRRCSEPAIAYAAKSAPSLGGSADGLTVEEEDGEDESLKKLGIRTFTRSHFKSRRSGELNLRGRASTSSLSSATTSPTPTRSSLDSLDSHGSELHQSKSPLPSKGFSGTLPPSVTWTAPSAGSALTSGECPELGMTPRGSPPREPLNWGTIRGSLHPNSWLKKGRRLSLTQQENLEKEENSRDRSTHKTQTSGKLVQEKGNEGERGGRVTSGQQKPKVSSKGARGPGGGVRQDSSSPPSHHCSTGNLHFPKSPSFSSSNSRQLGSNTADIRRETEEQKLPVTSLFYKQTAPSLSLFKRHKTQSVEDEYDTRLHQRRGSEPNQQVVERVSTLARARRPSDPGLKVSEVDSREGETAEARFCLSPHATKAVRDYFSSHRHSNPHSSQQVALALVESHREWLKRCSDPTVEPDYEQLLFAEESYV